MAPAGKHSGLSTSDSEHDELIKELKLWASLGELLAWDEATYLPPSAVTYRAEQKSFAATRYHSLINSDRMESYLHSLEQKNPAPGSWEFADLREWRRRRHRCSVLPNDLVSATASATTTARNEWVIARQESNFALLLPSLRKVVELKREEARLLSPASPYEALLQVWEPDAKVEELEAIFSALSLESRHMLSQIMSSDVGRKAQANVDKLRGNFPKSLQKSLGEKVASSIGFDFKRGRLDETAHPFCIKLGPDDVRITTRFQEADFTESFFTVLHETGHGLYEQGLPKERFLQPSGAYCSLGIHESQSRLWENIVGRSREFWEYFLPVAKETFHTWDSIGVDEFVLAINRVRPSLIRVGADELTYNLHILIRFGIEKDLIDGKLEVADLPERWNEDYRKTLGIVPPDDASGCLQDIHWSCGMFGYFPTYTLGNLYAAQWFEAADKALQLAPLFRAGRFHELCSWLRRSIHEQGDRLTAKDLCREVTGASLETGPFLRYLRKKYGPMYGVG